MFKLSFRSYCGMAGVPAMFTDNAEARTEIAKSLRRTRACGRKVTTLEGGKSWEVHEPEDAAMVPDWAGTLQLTHHTYACLECGSEHETREEAGNCCAWDHEEELH